MTRSVANVTLITFARFPRPGNVKTRLAKTIGADQAALFYKLCAERVFREIENLNCDVQRYVFYSDRKDTDVMQRWVGPQFRLIAQSGDDLGTRIERAFRIVFDRGAQKAIILGTDVPDLSASVIDDAINALDSRDVVVGPCRDGGYYLLGMNELHRELFNDIPWSTELVLERTLETVDSLGLTQHTLPALADIDTEEDLLRWLADSRPDEIDPIRDLVQGLDLVGDETLKNGGESP